MLLRLLTNLLVSIRSQHTGPALFVVGEHAFDFRFGEFEVILKPEQPGFEAKSLVFAGAGRTDQHISCWRRRTRRYRIGRGKLGKFERIVMPMKHRHTIAETEDDRL